MAIAAPDLSSRPYRLTIERTFSANPDVIFNAWTRRLDSWMAAPGTVLLTPAVDTAFYFETHHDVLRAPYYGRFLRLEPDKLLEFTWLSIGTNGKETLITVELAPAGSGTHLRLRHDGFADEESRDDHESAWLEVLKEL